MADAPAPFAPCALIPLSNHGATIAATVRAPRAHGLSVLLVDDGSDATTRTTLDTLARVVRGVELLRLPHDQGKGRAVSAGLRAASAAGFSHASQVDTDGQHDIRDAPRFHAVERVYPLALVCGVPVFDASVPRGRLVDRCLTHACVWLETLSFAARDSMCGYRLYPLAATDAELDRRRLPTRMGFDTGIAVRLYWRSVAVINPPTRVTCPAGGLSHFRLFCDNLHISAMHTRLLFGMLPHMPALLRRRRGEIACAV